MVKVELILRKDLFHNIVKRNKVTWIIYLSLGKLRKDKDRDPGKKSNIPIHQANCESNHKLVYLESYK